MKSLLSLLTTKHRQRNKREIIQRMREEAAKEALIKEMQRFEFERDCV